MAWPEKYTFYPDLILGVESKDYSLRPVTWEDRNPIRQWRNSQLEVLRQVEPLSQSEQDDYFTEVVQPQFAQEFPAQLMFTFLKGTELIGYGALVHIHWEDHRAEVSFLTPPERQDPTTFESDWHNYLSLIRLTAKNIGLHKLTTETYSLRHTLIPILEANGFVEEGVLRDHHFMNAEYTNSHIHALIL
jgi:RimJ/RimL family protein N-acetyltransferase